MTQLYLAYFGRPPDFDGLNFYLNQPNATVQSVAAAFSASPESQALYGTTFGAAQIDAIYMNLFNRHAEADGIAFWSNAVNSGAISPAYAAYNILIGAQNADAVSVANKMGISTLWMQHLNTAEEIVGYSGIAAVEVARQFLATVDSTAASVTAATANVDAAIAASVNAHSTGGVALTSSVTTANEGTTVFFTLDTAGKAAGTQYTYTITGVNAADVAGGQLTGTATVDANGNAVVQVTLTNDAATEGVETLTLSMANLSKSVTVSDTSTTPVQTFALGVAGGATSVDEGQSVVFTLTTTNVPAGTAYSYVITGVSASDVAGGQLTGTAIIGADGKANIQIALAADGSTEGAETLTLTVAGQAANVTVNDVSTAPVPTFALAGNVAAVDEGGTVFFTLTTTNVPAGTSFSYTLTGVSSADVVGGSLTGTAVVGADGKAVVQVTLVNDLTTEGAETLNIAIAGQSASATVNDTSLTPPALLTISATDVIPARDTNDVIIGQLGTITTLHASDAVHGGNGDDILRVIADNGATSVNGFVMDGVETLEVDSFGTGVNLGLVNVTGLQNVRSVNSTGDITLGNVGNVVNLDLQGNGNDSIDVRVGYTPAARALFTDQVVSVSDFNGDVWAGDVDGNGTEAAEIASHGSVGSDLTLHGVDYSTVTVTGEAELTLGMADATLTTVAAGAFDGGLNFSGEMTDDATITVGNGDNSLQVGFGDNGTIVTGSGDDNIDASGGSDASISAGDGDNYVTFDLDIDANVTAGSGDDDIEGSVHGASGSFDADLQRLVGTGEMNVAAGDGDNYVAIDADNYVGQINVITGSGDDTVYTTTAEDNATDLTVNVGDGDNYVSTNPGTGGEDFHNISITAGSGDDGVQVGNANSIIIDVGAGSNEVMTGYAYQEFHHDPVTHVPTDAVSGSGDITINASAGNNFVVVGGAEDVLTINLGGEAGDTNTVDVYAVGNQGNITTGAADDYVQVFSVSGSLDANLGDGDNVFNLGGYGGSTENADVTITTGAGDDQINLFGGGSGSGDIAATLDVQTGAGDDIVSLGYQGLEHFDSDTSTYSAAGYTIDGGTGANTLAVDTLDHVSGEDDFANVTNFQTLQVNGDASGSFDGILTGANNTGINHYVFTGPVADDLELTNMVNGVTVDFTNGNSDNYDFALDVIDPEGSSATINVAQQAGDEFEFDTTETNVENLTLNANVTLSDSGQSDFAYVQFNNFVADNLTTLTITGNTEVDIYGNEFSLTQLTTVNAGAMTGDLTLDLGGVIEAAGLTVLTGSGNDSVTMGIGDATVNVGNGDNDVYATEGGDVTVTAGSGDDFVQIGTSGSTDTVFAGEGDNVVYSYGDVANVVAGSGDDYVLAVGNATINVGDGDNEVWSFGDTATIRTGSGSDFVYVASGAVSDIDTGAGDDTIEFAAGGLTASDKIEGGAGDKDTLIANGSLGTQNDAFFFQIDGIETLQLSSGGNDLTLGLIASVGGLAHNGGLKNVVLSENGDDILRVTADFGRNLNVTLGNGNDSVISQLASASVNVIADDVQLTNADHLVGGAGTADTVTLHTTGAGTADLDALDMGFDKVVVSQTEVGDDITLTGTVDMNAGGALTIDAASMVDDLSDPDNLLYAGDFTFDGTGTTNAVTITGGSGAQSVYDITTGTGLAVINLGNTHGDDVINAGGAATVTLGNGNETVVIAGNSNVTAGNGNNSFDLSGTTATLNSGNGANTVVADATTSNTVFLGTVGSISTAANSVTVGAGSSHDSVTIRGNGNETVIAKGASVDVSAMGSGNQNVDASLTTATDHITTGAGNDTIKGGAGADVIIAGNGTNTITGGAGGDTMTGGLGVDTYIYNLASESSGVNVDTITNFTAGTLSGHDVINLSAVATLAGLAGGVSFIGNVSNGTIANTALPDAPTTTLNVVFVTSEHTLYADVNANGVIDTGDMAIELTGVNSMNAANIA
ncbi:hypothetical protein UC35_14410 [Ramlibacter tataouinensis]|uniref:DUF4214 domain-containing protein n=1 Tax=Ramlibacter tataouinensis TaxID=94132 RepID=A0A127JV20_9BURK|nr:hypothetical protein UC35_14410 [Ramlibacter tataouinensis]